MGLHTGYRAFQCGKHTALNEERIKQLTEIGFEFRSQAREKAIPDIPFEKRIEQLRMLQEELGDMNDLDHRFDK